MNYLDIYGREEEFKLKGSNHDGEDVIKSVVDLTNKKFQGRQIYNEDEETYSLFTGGSIYNDDEEPEICTPPCLEKKGFVEDIVNATIAQRLLLFEGFKRLKKDSVYRELKGYSSHENISFNEKKIPENIMKLFRNTSNKEASFADVIYSSIYRTIGPMLLLFFKNYESSYGIGSDHKNETGNRLQLRCEYNPDIDQLRAGIAFLYGSVRGIEKKIIENFNEGSQEQMDSLFYKIFPFSFESELPEESEKISNYNKISVQSLELDRPFIFFCYDNYRINFASYDYKTMKRNIKYGGSETKLTIFEKGREKEINLTDALKEYIDFFKDEIKYVSDDKTWDVLQEFAEGKRKFQMDEKKLPDYYVLNLGNIGEYERKLIGNDDPYIYLKNFKPQKEFEFMGNIVKRKGITKYRKRNTILNIELTSMDWDSACIDISIENPGKYKNGIREECDLKIKRDYFDFFNQLLKEKELSLEEKYNSVLFIYHLENFLHSKRYSNTIKNYEFLKEYIEYSNKINVNSDKLDLILNFERVLQNNEAEMPSLNTLYTIEKKILR